ncbi:hypothetical protein JCM10914A_50370 [Paenibacillus sp. JCM 10914]|uniref:sensor histidine kinase n=1 Tax=Paenibacillus sp. JCM 10914 TaxID=1236974 RepID=UPI0003CC7ADB|nr:ATP-binding protein [Paenibacillus sp. JCM 10914]GAE08327.1 ATP-binding region, ATPase-like [Paenibacillus sp. JCM 10914]
MRTRLDIRLAVVLISMTAGILIVFTMINIMTNHYHIEMYYQQSAEQHVAEQLNHHLEQALLQSIILTCLVSIALATMIGIYVARRISKPLVHMKETAESITQGDRDVRVTISGKDEIAALGASLNELTLQLQKQEQLRRNMTQDIAHELRTPLTTLKSYTRAMEDGIWEPAPERFRTCLHEIDRLIDLVTELEDLHDMESPEFRLDRNEVDLHSIIEQAIALMNPAYSEKKVDLQFEGATPVLIHVDADRLLQVLMNLLNNALHYTSEHGRVHVQIKEEADYIMIRIQDNGQGIHSEDLPYIFERLYRGDKSRSRNSGGSGMGLAIVRQIVQAHGGQVWAETQNQGQPGHGSSFFIRLPKE